MSVSKSRSDKARKGARAPDADDGFQRLMEGARYGGRDIPLSRQIFVNRNLRMDKIELVGFDMDYTLAIYQLVRLEDLAFNLTAERMVASRGWPDRLRLLRYDTAFVIRGLVIDKLAGNIFKMDRHNHVGRAYHGLTPLPKAERYRLYRDEKVALSSPRFAWIDTLFSLPEAALFAQVIEAEESAGRKLDYERLFRDIRECIDEVHRDGTLKEIVRSDIARYVVKDAELGPALHKLRSGGKKLFLLTNSLHDYTDAVMRHLLDQMLPEYPSWRNYFDVVITASGKPGFFSGEARFAELDAAGDVRPGEVQAFERGKTYAAGNRVDFERIVGTGGDRILYVGDHIYGDVLRSKKSALWRTCLVVEELERETFWLERHRSEMEELSRLEDFRLRLEDEASGHKTGLNVLDRRLERTPIEDPGRASVEAERSRMKRELETLRASLRDTDDRIELLQDTIENAYNRYWGLTFKEGKENSRFGEQIEDYACLYTSRVSNFVFYSPVQYFRSVRQTMPHERFALRLAPYGEEDATPAIDHPSKPAT